MGTAHQDRTGSESPLGISLIESLGLTSVKILRWPQSVRTSGREKIGTGWSPCAPVGPPITLLHVLSALGNLQESGRLLCPFELCWVWLMGGTDRDSRAEKNWHFPPECRLAEAGSSAEAHTSPKAASLSRFWGWLTPFALPQPQMLHHSFSFILAPILSVAPSLYSPSLPPLSMPSVSCWNLDYIQSHFPKAPPCQKDDGVGLQTFSLHLRLWYWLQRHFPVRDPYALSWNLILGVIHSKSAL